MTSTFTADWYDEAMVAPGAPAMLPLEESPWLPVYERIAAGIEPNEDVVDLGCGTGRFIELLYRRNHYGPIIGVDWSMAALAEAERYAHPRHREAVEPQWDLRDLADWEPNPYRAGNTIYVCTEVLEHLEDDVGLVRRIPPGHRFMFSVPNYHSASHLRTFPGLGGIWDRYARYLTFQSWQMVGTERKGIHVVATTKRADSW